ncbi:MAG: hypothetical protein ABFR47_02465 [Verrucomicrobiota bacterium]
MSDPTKQIWAYLHNELSPEDRERFEQELLNDPGLHEALEACRQTHQDLESILPQLEGEDESDDKLVEGLIAEWESEHPEHAEKPVREPRRKILYFSLPLAAAAAAVFLLLALPRHSGPVQWQRTTYGTTPQLRGQPGAEPHYTRSELEQVGREMQNAVETRLATLSSPTKPWMLQVQFQELSKGALTLEVSGHPRQSPDDIRAWRLSLDSLDSIRENIPRLGRQVAEDLAAGQNAP